MLCVTWNVGESKPEPGSPFFRWVHEAAFNTQLAVVGLQEIEMGSSSGGRVDGLGTSGGRGGGGMPRRYATGLGESRGSASQLCCMLQLCAPHYCFSRTLTLLAPGPLSPLPALPACPPPAVALAAAKDAFSHKMQERGNTNAKFWSAGVLQALGGERHWHQVGLRQLRCAAAAAVPALCPATRCLPSRVPWPFGALPSCATLPCPSLFCRRSGMLVLVYARNHLRSSIGEVTTASVACGVLGVGGNKGAVAVEFSVHRRRIAVVCSHFAAHQVGRPAGEGLPRDPSLPPSLVVLTFQRRLACPAPPCPPPPSCRAPWRLAIPTTPPSAAS